MADRGDRNYIPNQVFIGCPSKTIRPKYEQAIEVLKKKYPISFIMVGRGGAQDAEDLLKIIKEKLYSSSKAIFDATAGNANVSLEYGLAEAGGVPPILYLSTHKRSGGMKQDSPIISDLAGKRRNTYAQQTGLLRLLAQAAATHVYTTRFERALKRRSSRLSKGEKKRIRSLALKVIHVLDAKDQVRREDIFQELLGEGDPSNYKRSEIESVIHRLREGGLIKVDVGRYSTVRII